MGERKFKGEQINHLHAIIPIVLLCGLWAWSEVSGVGRADAQIVPKRH